MIPNAARTQSAADQDQNMTFLLAPTPHEENPLAAAAAAQTSNTLAIPSTTGPVGEAGLPPARPSSSHHPHHSRAGTSTGPPSRRGLPGLSATGRNNYQTDPSPPPTATSRSTHVPNIISSAFLRPNSSKRTSQDQRPISPPGQQFPIARPSIESGRRSHRHRNSNASIVTVDGQQRPLVDPDAPPMPTSRGTGTTAAATVTQADANRMGSMESGATLLPLKHARLPPPEPLQVPGTQTRSSSLQAQKSPKSNKSLHATWGRHSRSTKSNDQHAFREGHTKLASAPSSPSYAPEKEPVKRSTPDVGRNYEYYNGNAVFYLRGRLINSRQKPLNIATALLAFLPAVLFFIFS